MFNSVSPKILLLLVCVATPLACNEAAALEYEWAWIKGSKAANPPDTRGTQNVAAPENTPQGLWRCGLWQDETGVVWLYGGFGQDAGSTGFEENGLWKFDPASGNWAWIWGDDSSRIANYYLLGGPSPYNRPGARTNAQVWTDGGENLWLFGGKYGTICHHDFWKYNFALGQWTWVAGDGRSGIPGNYGTKGVAAAENYPNGREGAATWKDSSGNFWMFGGLGPVGHRLNDMWKFNPQTGYWTWMAGGSTSNTTSTYTVKGVAAPENDPGGRSGSVGWTDPQGNLWIFGGQLLNGTYTDDIWKYDVTLGQWAYMDGTTTGTVQPEYGVRNIPGENNTPGGRAFMTGAADSSGNLFLFGGGIQYQQPSGAFSYYRKNDLWKYDIASGNWSWIGGSQGMDEFGVYGTLGTADADNIPGARLWSAVFTDEEDNLWIFGGFGRGESTIGYLNDLWKVSAVPDATVAGWELY